MMLVVLLGGAALLSSLLSHPTTFVRVVAALVTGALAGFTVIVAWMVFIWAQWDAGYLCPDRGSGPGRVVRAGWGETTMCDYVRGEQVVAVHEDAGWFFSLPWLIGTTSFTLAVLAVAFWVIRAITRLRGATDVLVATR
jgi:hypothetical protein